MASGRCVECGEGLECALGSDMRHFEDFQSQGSQSVFPVVVPGYLARHELTNLFKCGAVGDCPGGLPGVCAPGRRGELCGHCAVGWKTTVDGCVPRLRLHRRWSPETVDVHCLGQC